MKTILDKIPILIKAGQTHTILLPEAFCIKHSLFMIVHNASNEKLKVTISDSDGHTLSQDFAMQSFPSIIVFDECSGQESLLNDIHFTSVSFTPFHDFEGMLTYRVKNPVNVIATYRKN